MPLPEASFLAIADDLPVGISLAKVPDGELIYRNKAYRQMMERGGQTAAPICRIEDGKNGESAPDLVEDGLFARAIARQKVVEENVVVSFADGSKLHARVAAHPVALQASEGGAISHVIEVWTTREPPRTQVEQEAAATHQRLLDVVNHAPVILFSIDRAGIITLAKGRPLPLLGMDPERMLGASVFELYRDNEVVLSHLRRALAGESFTATFELGPLMLETWYAPVGGPEGGVLGVATDVTERMRMQATLLSAERMVSVGTIAASVAHEINNPLSYVVACVDLMVREGPGLVDLVVRLQGRYPRDAEVAKVQAALTKLAEPFNNIRDGVERMRLIARDLRTFARVDDHDVTEVDIHEVLRSAIRMSSNETRYRAQVETEFGELPGVAASEPRLAQVFLNVLVNAAQAFPDGRCPQECKIRIVTSQDQDGKIVIEVSDNGPGIPSDILPRIFEPFFTTKPVGVGTGLGLSVCRNILEAYGGTISAESEAGLGTSFFIRLPPVSSALDSPNSQKLAGKVTADNQVRILVVDDDHILGNAFRLTLSQEFSVKVVASGARAIELLSAGERYDFIFCDLMMPTLTGMDVFAELSRRRPEVVSKILFMTGGAYSQEIRQFIARVPNRCLQKPFDPVSVIREALAAKARQVSAQETESPE